MSDVTVEQLVLSHTEAGVRTLTFNRPRKKNAFTPTMYAQLVAELEAAAKDPAARVVLLTGAGDAFTSGNDLADFMNTPPAGTDSPVFRLLLTLLDYEKPIVAAVNGVAVGIGTTMLFHCDLVYAAESAKFRMPFVNLGLVPEGGSSVLLPFLSGHVRAAELLHFGDFFTAQEAKDAGIANAVLPSEQLLARATERALALAKQPAASVRLSKRLLREPLRQQVRDAIHREGELFLERLGSPEAAEAFTAFFEKRAPDFTQFD